MSEFGDAIRRDCANCRATESLTGRDVATNSLAAVLPVPPWRLTWPIRAKQVVDPVTRRTDQLRPNGDDRDDPDIGLTGVLPIRWPQSGASEASSRRCAMKRWVTPSLFACVQVVGNLVAHPYAGARKLAQALRAA